MLPPFIVESFNAINPAADEAEFYGPWNSVLNHYFRIEEGYIICPHYPVFPGGEDDFAVLLTVQKDKIPLFFVEVTAPRFFEFPHYRISANKQIYKRFTQLYDSSPQVIHGVSAFGTLMHFYKLDKNSGHVESASPQAHPDLITDTVPQSCWNINLLDQVGYAKLEEVVHAAKAMGRFQEHST